MQTPHYNIATEKRIDECLDVMDEISDVLEILFTESDGINQEIEHVHWTLLQCRDALIRSTSMSPSPEDDKIKQAVGLE